MTRLLSRRALAALGVGAGRASAPAATPAAPRAGRTVLEVATGARPPKARRSQPEAVMQRLLVKRIRLDPRTRDLLWSAWPGGGKRDKRTAALLKAEGVNPGPGDLWFIEPRVRQHLTGAVTHHPGLVIEMKAPKGRLTSEQARWIAELQWRHWHVVVCYSDEDAWRALIAYLAL